MKPKKILTDEKFLSQKSVEVDPLGTVSATGLSRSPRIPVLDIIDEMIATAKANEDNCLGLAANQIGYLVRIFVMRLEGKYVPIINPKIVSSSTEVNQDAEHCLSRPGKEGVRKRRHKWIIMECTVFNEKGEVEVIREKAKGLPARVIQHGIDHFEGKLI
jgi:peptide deformylase